MVEPSLVNYGRYGLALKCASMLVCMHKSEPIQVVYPKEDIRESFVSDPALCKVWLVHSSWLMHFLVAMETNASMIRSRVSSCRCIPHVRVNPASPKTLSLLSLMSIQAHEQCDRVWKGSFSMNFSGLMGKKKMYF